MNTEYGLTEDEGRYLPGLAALFEGQPIPEDREETYRLALESAHRWLGRYNLSPALRLRALRAVVEAALSDGP